MGWWYSDDLFQRCKGLFWARPFTRAAFAGSAGVAFMASGIRSCLYGTTCFSGYHR